MICRWREQDAWLAASPESNTTVFQNLAAQLLDGAHGEAGDKAIHEEII